MDEDGVDFPVPVKKIGVLVAVEKNDGNIYVGWSKIGLGDKFDRYFGTGIAMRRAMVNPGRKVPYQIKDDYKRVS